MTTRNDEESEMMDGMIGSSTQQNLHLKGENIYIYVCVYTHTTLRNSIN